MIPPYVLVLSLGMVGAALLTAAAAEGRFDRLPEQQYLPASFEEPTVTCGHGGPEASRPVKREVASAFEARWYSSHWRAAQERSLYVASLAPGAEGTRTYRFTWLRSFHQPVVVRIDDQASGEMRLTATMLSGDGGFSPGRIARRVERVLSAAEAAALREAVTSSKVFDLAPADCR
ncbi:hypothetical protein, partial [Phenylobacterium sp.]|uniref:hypothetical protein n=1 Tax=Phenylobacterium sp. TaxID=1871053 RepID=UPI002E3291C1